VCGATDYPVAERLMYPLADRRKVAIMQSCLGSGGDDMQFDRLIPNPIDQNPWAHWRSPMDMMRQG